MSVEVEQTPGPGRGGLPRAFPSRRPLRHGFLDIPKGRLKVNPEDLPTLCILARPLIIRDYVQWRSDHDVRRPTMQQCQKVFSSEISIRGLLQRCELRSIGSRIRPVGSWRWSRFGAVTSPSLQSAHNSTNNGCCHDDCQDQAKKLPKKFSLEPTYPSLRWYRRSWAKSFINAFVFFHRSDWTWTRSKSRIWGLWSRFAFNSCMCLLLIQIIAIVVKVVW